jgi:uncharacterized protein YggE
VERPRAHLRLWLPLALSLLALAAPAAALGAERTVSVTGKATLEVPNDSARIGLGVNAVRPTKAAALRATSARLARVIAAVQRIPGVGDGDVRTGSVTVGELRRDGRKLYRTGQGITVTLHQPDRAGELIGAAVRAGAGGVRGPTFFVGDTEAAYARALAAAFEKARAKAQALATQAGATLGPAQTIVEAGAIEPPQPLDAAGKGGGETVSEEERSPPTKPSTTTVTATVNVVFSLL